MLQLKGGLIDTELPEDVGDLLSADGHRFLFLKKSLTYCLSLLEVESEDPLRFRILVWLYGAAPPLGSIWTDQGVLVVSNGAYNLAGSSVRAI